MKEKKTLDQLKETNPFQVPEGYMQGLSARVMEQLPEETYVDPPLRVTLFGRVRPWLYMAAVFAGLGLFFNLLVDKGDNETTAAPDSLIVQTTVPDDRDLFIQDGEDEDYMEYLEAQYVGYVLAEEIGNFE